MLKGIFEFGLNQAKDTVKDTVYGYVTFYKWCAIGLVALLSSVFMLSIIALLKVILGG